MGFFSSNCEGCSHPLLCIQATNSINRWMNAGVAITSGGSVLRGSYDGYGSLDGFDAVVGDSTVWHEACWERAGRPMDFRGASKPAADQGWFFDDGEHDLARPGMRGR